MPCYRVKIGGGFGFMCGKLGPHCAAGCGAPGDAFLCDYPVGPGKTCDAHLCEDHAHEVAPDVHYCPGHFAEWEKFVAAGGVREELANVVPFARAGRPAAVQAGFFDGPLGQPYQPPREVKRQPKAPAPPAQRGLFDGEGELDLNQLSRPALAAAMKGGTAAWGRMGSSTDHVRYAEQLEKRPGKRRTCYCGCNGPVTHRGMANGVALTSACELGIARWVKTGHVRGKG